MNTYYSRHCNLQINIGKKIIQFKRFNNAGIYQTDDKKIIAALESSPYFNSSLIGGFFRKKIKNIIDFEKPEVITGIRGATHNEKAVKK